MRQKRNACKTLPTGFFLREIEALDFSDEILTKLNRMQALFVYQ
jgi:hypothetical protein